MNEYIVSILTVQFEKGVNEHEQTHNCFKPNATHVRTPAHTTRPSGTREPHAETDHIRTQKNVDENELANILVTFITRKWFSFWLLCTSLDVQAVPSSPTCEWTKVTWAFFAPCNVYSCSTAYSMNVNVFLSNPFHFHLSFLFFTHTRLRHQELHYFH